MKKFIAIILAVLMAASVLVIGASASSDFFSDTVYGWFCEGENISKPIDEYVFADDSDLYKVVATYDANHKLTKVEVFSAEDGEDPVMIQYGIVSDRVGNTYKINLYYLEDEEGFVFEQVWNVEENDNGKLLKLTQFYLNQSGEPVCYNDFTYTYDANGNHTKIVAVDYEDGEVYSTDTFEYSYNANGKVTEMSDTYVDNKSETSIFKAIYSYDAEGKLIKLSQGYVVDGIFNREYETVYTYTDATHRSYEFYEDEDIYTGDEVIDANGNVLSRIDYDKNGEPDEKLEHEYDAAGDLIKNLCYRSYTEESGWNLTYTETIKYHVFPVKEEPKKENPETGDATPVIILASVMALSLAGVVITKKLAK